MSVPEFFQAVPDTVKTLVVKTLVVKTLVLLVVVAVEPNVCTRVFASCTRVDCTFYLTVKTLVVKTLVVKTLAKLYQS